MTRKTPVRTRLSAWPHDLKGVTVKDILVPQDIKTGPGITALTDDLWVRLRGDYWYDMEMNDRYWELRLERYTVEDGEDIIHGFDTVGFFKD